MDVYSLLYHFQFYKLLYQFQILQVTLPVLIFTTYCISFSFTFTVSGSHDCSLYLDQFYNIFNNSGTTDWILISD